MKMLCGICFTVFLLSFLIGACGSFEASYSTPEINNVVSEIPTIITVLPAIVSTPASALASPTALPAISIGTAKQTLAQFVQENGGCKLPCVLGLSPITSNQISVQNFSQYFQNHAQKSNDQVDDLDIYSYYKDNFGGVSLVFWKNRTRIDVGLDTSFTKDDIRYISFSTGVYKHTGEGANEKAEILSGHPDYDGLLGQFSLARILSDYGSPMQVWVRPFPDDELHRSTYVTGSYPFDFVLIYPNKGFAVEYIARVKDESNGYLIACPDTSYMKIASWNPERQPSFAEIAAYFAGTDSLSVSNFAEFKQIQDVTSLSIGDFYQKYKNPDFDECIKTPRNLWP